MSQDWRLRAGREDDIRAMYMLDLVCFDEPFRFTLPAMRQFVLQPGAIVAVAEADAQLAGFIVVHLVRTGLAYVVTLDVAAEFRRRGLASALMTHAEQAAITFGAKTLALHVHTGNPTATAFYERSGYARGSVRNDFYGAGLDAWLYVKPLNDQAAEAPDR